MQFSGKYCLRLGNPGSATTVTLQTVCWRGCLPQCMLGTPQVWAWRPPRPDPLNFPPGCGPGDPPQARPPQLPLGCGPGDLQGMLGYHPLDTCKACWDTTCNACWEITHLPPPPSPLWTEFLTHTSENITLPQTSFAGGNNRLAPAASVLEILDPPLQSRCFYLD